MASRPSNNTTKPSSPIFLAAAAAKVTTSPWVLSATVGMFLATKGAFNVVFFTFETSETNQWMSICHPSNTWCIWLGAISNGWVDIREPSLGTKTVYSSDEPSTIDEWAGH